MPPWSRPLPRAEGAPQRRRRPRVAVGSPAPVGGSATARIPTRICDLGGWTDTWFAQHGAVCHLAVWPGIEASVTVTDGAPGVDVHVVEPVRTWHWSHHSDPHASPDPLLAATLSEAARDPARRYALEVTSGVPAGASMGTSASTCVAILTAFDRLHGARPTPGRQAARAHRVETTRLGWQSGIQDQFAAASGAVHLITMDAYPNATCRAVAVTPAVLDALDARLLVVYLGRGHSSTAVHDQVIRALADAGPDDERLHALRRLARTGAAALARGDLQAYGRCLADNTEVQRQLEPALVCADAERVLTAAREARAWGWKVNGAGGDGGTVSVLCADAAQRDALAGAIARGLPACRRLSVRLARNRRRPVVERGH